MGESRTARIMFKWVGFVCAIWVQSIAGNNYTFANYASDLKHVMGYSQVELNSLSIAKDIGKSVGLLAGFLSEYLPPQIILLIGAGVGFLGYGSTWLIISERIAPPSLWQMCIVMFLGGNSSTWMNTACLTTCLRNFPQSRGPVTGILKGFVGLSTAIFTVICSSLFTGSSSAFVLLLAFVPLFTCMIGAIFLREVPVSTGPEEDLEEQSCFNSLNIAAVAIAVYLLGYTLSAENLSPSVKQGLAWILMVFILSPIIVPAKLFVHNWFRLRKTEKKRTSFYRSPEPTDDTTEPLLHKFVTAAAEAQHVNQDLVVDQKRCADDEEEETSHCRGKQLGDNYSFWQASMSLDFWLLFLGFFTGVGAGMATINNVAQIGGSLGYSDVTMFVSLISIFGFFGRLISGTLSEYYYRSRGIPRTAWMAASKVLMIVGYLILAFPVPGALHIGSIIVGCCFGFHVTIMVPVASEMFGLKSFGVIYNVLNLDMSLGSFLFSYLAGYIYDFESRRTADSDWPDMSDSDSLPLSKQNVIWGDLLSSTRFTAVGETECYGSHCFELLFISMSVVLALGFVVDVILTLRLRPLYERLADFKQKLDPGIDSEASPRKLQS
ncbi:hypothetical protein MPTK1_2g06490 [Marchantia polymorpha subsp. ruderalis]|uniref:Uncharacterized protein n=2 Tax=Marchantia polymorpha TaxID=3197 RepID=A0A176WEU3_MARPO|nr:hypothetical protein AXG93_3522s1150 [Marchantia polymorpha subsp. ruderalis]PTQ44248.1 hypothetical protein MARPO_0021s0104 [Marchantia polymorpha]BBN01323.1 hypothetical protein Mp_2g06490 [Marchantia polymorpha subsp. ruderalis]|eukprot:PTQ44248.1 hypothetical protein MARPO_0021s0104 [Marchantia polymorpha]